MYKKNYQRLLLSLMILSQTGNIFAQNTELSPDSILNQEKHIKANLIILSESDLGDDEMEQNISGLLNSGNDPFESATQYNLYAYRFKKRGYDGRYESVYINGLEFNNAETGRFSYSLIGGLNDAVKNRESTLGITTSGFAYGSLGGAVNINTQAASYRKGTRASLIAGNGNYNGRLMASYSTGLLQNGWAFNVIASKRSTIDGYESVEGNTYDAWSVGLAIQKILNEHHSLAFNAYYAPNTHGASSACSQETYDLRGNNLYNPNWGYQEGKVRNAKMVNSQAPIATLMHEWKKSNNFKLNTSVGFIYSMYSKTALNWYKSSDPRPDYYRNLPSYYESENPETAALMTEAWKNDDSYYQLNWDNLYQINYLANYQGMSARYILEERHDDQMVINFSSTANAKLDFIKVNGGINASSTKGMHYKTVSDLLGANYWIDIDPFTERDFNDSYTLQNDLDNPNRQVTVGDKFGYNYNIFVQKANAWANAEYEGDFIEAYIAGKLTGTEFYREGLMRNGRSPENSYGVGEKHDFLDYSVKGGVTYKPSGRHIFSINGLYETNAPLARNSYVSPRTKDDAINGLTSEKIISADVNYFLHYSFLTARFSAFYTDFKDQSELHSFYYTGSINAFVNQALIGVNKTHKGIELGLDAKLSSIVGAYGALSLGKYQYKNRPTAVTSWENGLENDTYETVYLRNFYTSETPQIASTVGLKFSLPKYWYLNINGNYCEKSYISMFYQRRTTETVTYGMTDKEIKDATAQEELKSGFTLDASIGKSFRFQHKYSLYCNLSVKNILNKEDIQTGGYEQSRTSTDSSSGFYPSNYYYAYGRTFMLFVGFRF